MAIAENLGSKIDALGRNLEKKTKKDDIAEEKPAAELNGNGNAEIFKNEMSDLVEILSKLNPMAEDFVPSSLANHPNHKDNPVSENRSVDADGKKRNGKPSRRKRELKIQAAIAQREDAIRKTVYVSDVDQQVTEELLAGLFLSCGPIVDCRICGDPLSVLRFAFVEFYNQEDAKAALNLSGTILGFYPLKVLPSKTAIAPVNPTYLPKSDDEREMSLRTIYCTNIGKKVTQVDVMRFFESFYGKVQRLRLLGDKRHSTRSAFVEFTMTESAIAALNCSGVVLGSRPIRVAPSKTPVRPRRAIRPTKHLVPAS